MSSSSSISRRISHTSNHLRSVSHRLSQVILKWEKPWSQIFIIHKALDPGLVPVVREIVQILCLTTAATTLCKEENASNSISNNNNNKGNGTIEEVDKENQSSSSSESSSGSSSPSDSTPPIPKASVKRRIFVDSNLKNDSFFNSPFTFEKNQACPVEICYWTQATIAEEQDNIDMILTIGGDGTVLYASWLFQECVPPILTIHMGSMGFLTTYQPKKPSTSTLGNSNNGTNGGNNGLVKSVISPEALLSSSFYFLNFLLERIRTEGMRLHVRMRFKCMLYRKVARKAAENGSGGIYSPINNRWTELGPMPKIEQQSNTPVLSSPVLNQDLKSGASVLNSPYMLEGTFHILNDLVIDRGPSPYMSVLELFGDSRHLTTVQADGLVVSTPTGSTAYSLSAGGSLVHPLVPSLLITPICAHTLSFRPMLLPDSMHVKIYVPSDSRNTAWASFDGRHRVELRQGDYISIVASEYPVPTICRNDCTSDWFESLNRCLHWNEREAQKPFSSVPVEKSFLNQHNQETFSTSSTPSLQANI